MTPLERRNNNYVQRMAQDMRIRNFAASTIDSYTYHVDKFCSHFGQPADQLTLEHIRDYQLYLVNEKKVSWSSFNQAVCGLRFLYEVSLGQTLDDPAHPLREASQETPRRPLRPRSIPTDRMCSAPETSDGPADLLRGGTASQRSNPLAHPRHRRPAAADPRYERKRAQRKARARLAKTARRTARVLEDPPPRQLSFSWQDAGRSPLVGHGAEGLQAGGRHGGNQESGVTPHTLQTFLRHRHAGSGSRSADDQQAAGAFQFRHHDDLSARATSALRSFAQPDRLAAGAAVSAVDREASGCAATRTEPPSTVPNAQRPPSTTAEAPRPAAQLGTTAEPRNEIAAAGDRPAPAVCSQLLDWAGTTWLGRSRVCSPSCCSAARRRWAGIPMCARRAVPAAKSTIRAAIGIVRSVPVRGEPIGWTRPVNCCCLASTISKSSSRCRTGCHG